MGVEEKILEYQLGHGVFDNAEFSGSEGIAKRAVKEGFSALSVNQKSVLESYLSKKCSGVIDPGGDHNGCTAELKGKELLDAYHRCDDTECLQCGSCYSEEAYISHQREQFFQD
ncbi:hypothetical protein WKI13_09175 [Teredinibacter turnerae]|uniref:hypothetical protein n=1 Tax=Teredinibacter turnerae TaxID=2426 RepID=UPI000369A5E8|nr:hypothetical protein [Teredinibacter turnerae]